MKIINPRETLEAKIISTLMLENDPVRVKSKLTNIKPKYFKNKNFTSLYEDILSINSQGLATDVSSVMLNSPDKYDPHLLIEIQEYAELIDDIDSYILQIKDLWAKDQIDKLLLQNRKDFQYTANINQTIELLTHDINEIKKEVKRTKYINQSELRDFTKSTLSKEPDKMMRVPYCMPKMHDYIELFRGQVHVIGAESGVGKTALCLSAIQWQYRSQVNSVFFCCESKAEELLIRLACQRSTNSYSNVVKGFKYGNRDAFFESLDHFNVFSNNLQLYGRDNYKHTIEDIDHTLYEIQKTTRIDMVYIDYFQTLRMETGSKFKKQFEMYEDIIDAIAQLAVKYNCGITLLSQLNRDRADGSAPTIMNLRGASAIENVAHIISFIHMDQEAKKNTDLRVKPVVLYSGKTRLIAPFNIRLSYDSYCGLFHEQMENVPFPWQGAY